MAIPLPSRHRPTDWLWLLAFVPLYVLMDWLSFLQPLFGLNITPWNPDPALGLVVWIRFGKRVALPWYLALMLSELWIRGMPAGVPLTLLLSAQLVLGYGAIAEVLRHAIDDVEIVNDRKRLSSWLGVVVIGLMLNGILNIVLLWLAGLVPAGAFFTSALRFFIGDFVGVVISMPIFWMLSNREGRRGLAAALQKRETAGYLLFAAVLIAIVFNAVIEGKQYKHFYFLFLPIIWAATRHGLIGTSLVAAAVQLGLIGMFHTTASAGRPFAEVQLLVAALALVGFFIGVMVDEQRATSEGLKQSLRLAAAGEMAAALAHELNQPMTALAAYGKACEHLLERGDTGPLLVDSIGKMVREAGRASDVVRRLREFFHTGAMHLETARVDDIFATVGEQFRHQCLAQQTTLTFAAEPGLVARADTLQLELVLRNLIANSLDAVHPQAVRRITVTASALKEQHVQVTVADNGPGVANAVSARLFAPFVSGKSNGLGLGLALSRAIVEAHGGRLWAEFGDTGMFHFILPLGNQGELLEP